MSLINANYVRLLAIVSTDMILWILSHYHLSMMHRTWGIMSWMSSQIKVQATIRQCNGHRLSIHQDN